MFPRAACAADAHGVLVLGWIPTCVGMTERNVSLARGVSPLANGYVPAGLASYSCSTLAGRQARLPVGLACQWLTLLEGLASWISLPTPFP